MNADQLIIALHRTASDNHRCFGCGYENKCGIHGCAINRQAADTIAQLLSEVEQVKAERNQYKAALRNLHEGETEYKYV